MQADPVAQERIQQLAEKCNQGLLDTLERREYETYVHVGNVIGILQARARLDLKESARCLYDLRPDSNVKFEV